MKRKCDNDVTHEHKSGKKRSYDPEVKCGITSKLTAEKIVSGIAALLCVCMAIVIVGIWMYLYRTYEEQNTIEENTSSIDKEADIADDTEDTAVNQEEDEINYRELVEKKLEEEKNTTIDPENPYNLPPSYFEEQALADKMIEKYLSKEWDGNPIEEEGHIFSLSNSGELLMDSYLTSPSEIHPQHCLDIPKDMINIHNPMFILGEGTYLIEGWRIVKYVRGEKIPLQGKGLDWSGMDTENYRPYNVYFYYDKLNDTLFIVASSIPYDFSDKEMVYNIGIYLYVMPDRTKSEIKFIDEIINLNIDNLGLYYLDTEGVVWRNTTKNGKFQFVKSTDENLKDKFSNLGIAEGEIEFSWWCTFADGEPGERREFPEGTFTHPVTTTPRVGLTEVELSYRYKDIYSS